MGDLREYPRIPKEVQVKITELSYPFDEQNSRNGSGRNISSGGLRVRMDTPMKPETVVEVKMSLLGFHSYKKNSMFVDFTEKSPLTVVGKVVWCREDIVSAGYDVGIEFVNIYEDDRAGLVDYLNMLQEGSTESG